MGRGINLKVPTASVITALQARLEKNELDKKHNEKIEKEYPALHRKWQAEMIKQVMSKLKPSGVSFNSYRRIVEVSFDLPEGFEQDSPNRDSRSVLSKYEIDEIEGAIRMLSMTEEEYVTASTMRSISQYL